MSGITPFNPPSTAENTYVNYHTVKGGSTVGTISVFGHILQKCETMSTLSAGNLLPSEKVSDGKRLPTEKVDVGKGFCSNLLPSDTFSDGKGCQWKPFPSVAFSDGKGC